MTTVFQANVPTFQGRWPQGEGVRLAGIGGGSASAQAMPGLIELLACPAPVLRRLIELGVLFYQPS